jgi:hypothetical protein
MKHRGVDKVVIEMIKYALSDVKIQVLNLLNNCWQSKYIPQNWTEERNIPVFKKNKGQYGRILRK